jgi:hypothetical protein
MKKDSKRKKLAEEIGSRLKVMRKALNISQERNYLPGTLFPFFIKRLTVKVVTTKARRTRRDTKSVGSWQKRKRRR